MSYDPSIWELPPGESPPFDDCQTAEACAAGQQCLYGRCVAGVGPGRNIDLLFLVDNSNSMMEEQVALAREFPAVARALASGDLDEDGVMDIVPFHSLNIGVVSSDMGTGAYSVGGVCERGLGDDGILRPGPSPDLDGCSALDPPFLTVSEPTRDESEALAGEFACLARLGTGGCGFEHQLEASLKSVTPATVETELVGGTRGHGLGANAGFVRPDTLLVVVYITDEDDCSTPERELFDPDPNSSEFPGSINLRCHEYPEALYPLARYVDGFLRLRPADRLVVGAMTGVPPDIATADYDTILGDPRMEPRIRPDGVRLRTVCGEGDRSAFPGRRIVETIDRLDRRGVSTFVRSVCDFKLTQPLLQAIVAADGE